MTDLSRVAARNKLAARPSKEPYWQRMSKGRYLGYRPSTLSAGLGSWLARFNDPDTGRKPGKSLGDYGQLAPNERFDAARRDAERWFEHLAMGGSTQDPTVWQACEVYADGDKEKLRRLSLTVKDQPIAGIKLTRLRESHVKVWRKHLEGMPAITAKRTKRGNGGMKSLEVVTHSRSAATINRDMTMLRAALNAALARGEVPTALAWTNALKPGEAKGRRQIYLDRDQRRALLENLPGDAAALCRGLSLLPLRPGALASLRVHDFDARTGVVLVGTDKANDGRSIKLPEEHVAYFKEQAKGKTPAAPLFAREDGSAWNSDAWKKPIKDAVRAAKLPEGATAYALRHSTITDLIVGGLDTMTVAKLAGTSLAMIERHYGHLRGDHAAKALAGLSL
ncbi:integrase [Lysobacter sp. TY2-98]|uniref:tyrosine-type recombinase/integrase n=1 Tax=Lysobacter sp. TY2-98 TaxID=2290922 RepID=UPI000E207C68|nr:tyrosine-type recombinase/integrase [Lysobacter sp. TY2-98]AXK71660.1 integrase [Lysobacter sp. TY2-98]